MKTDETDQHSGNDKYMQCEKSGQCCSRNNRSTEHQFHDHGPGNGDAACDRSPDSKAPVRVLIKPQHLPTERHAQRHQQEKDANDPGELSWKFVGSKEEDLHHVNEYDGYHEIRAPSVQCTDEPAQSYVVVQGLQTAPRLTRRGHVDQGQQDSGDELEKKDGERRAAKYVEPARRVARHRMLRRFTNRSGELQATVEPLANLGNQPAHGGFFPKREAVGDPGVGNSPAWMVTSPSC